MLMIPGCRADIIITIHSGIHGGIFVSEPTGITIRVLVMDTILSMTRISVMTHFTGDTHTMDGVIIIIPITVTTAIMTVIMAGTMTIITGTITIITEAVEKISV